jgi:phage tail-like protein
VLSLIGPNGAETRLGGFTEATGLPEKLSGVYNVSDVTLKRGVVNSGDLWNWINDARSHGKGARRDAILNQKLLEGAPMRSWKLQNATPAKYDETALGHTGGEVAIEELVLTAERVVLVTSP